MYEASNWYWIKSDGEVYSSAKQEIIKADNPEYLGWLDAGNMATPWPKDEDGKESNTELDQVLSEHEIVSKLPDVIFDVPVVVNNAQFQAALINANLFDKAEAAVKQSADKLVGLAWAKAQTISLNGVLAKFLASKAGGFTVDQINKVFLASVDVVF